MRITFVSYVCNRYSGVGNRVYYLSKTLASKGHEVYVVTRKGQEIPERVNPLLVNWLEDLQRIPPVPLPQVTIFNLLVRGILKGLAGKQDIIDIQHIHMTILPDFLENEAVLTCQGTEYGLSTLNSKKTSIVRKITLNLEINTFKKVKKIIAASNYIKNEIINNYNLNKRIDVIPNGINYEEFQNINRIRLKEKLGVDNILLFLGGYSYRKGFHILMESLSRIHGNWKLIIAGPESSKTRILAKFLFKKYNLENRIIDLGEIREREKLKIILNEADIYIHPALYEPFSVAVLEALASGKAIVASNRGGTPEAIGDAGILIEPNASELAKAIQALLDDEELRKKYSLLAKERAKLFDWNNIANLYIESLKNGH